ncbi:MAG TPA: prepilin-type N-terminal cleavage/methylation domain-containing protein [Terriglobales bacterium]|nr:prepilin-type N-terminal cleavage/methylation domain-containing protein [Terriglobales bacterium]
MQRRRTNRGFTLVELMVSMAVTLIVLGTALTVFKKSMDAATTVTAKAEMQANARAAINGIVRDLSQAGSGGMPWGGITGIPVASLFAHDTNGNDYLANNTYSQGVLYMVTPAWKSGPTSINPDPEDGVTLAYVDASLDWSAYSTTTINPAGDQVTMPPGTTPAVTDPAYGPKVGDLMLLRNVNGTAVGVVTAPPGGSTIQFSAGDPLQMNGGIAGLANPASNPATYPATTVNRLLMISYYIQPLDAQGNPLPFNAPGAADFRLMRQVNALPPVPVAEHVVSLKFSYDLSDPNTAVETSNVFDAKIPNPGGGAPPTIPAYNEIRNVYVSVVSRSARANPDGGFYYSTLFTNVSPRNLSFHDRYQ